MQALGTNLVLVCSNIHPATIDDDAHADAALRGSSYLKLPRVLQFFTGNIGLHHVHHLCARIPNYNLERSHRENAVFADVPTLSLLDGLRAVNLKLWDEERGQLVSFAEARQRVTLPAAPAVTRELAMLGSNN
jgi:omega-6 fatty acid desaturase (delta-12 desaturase)